ncbi:hypothetical protein SAY87_024067 [Trapa incisa]|uniref:HECT-type E3 ubiquitin transferase n=1 Tax=Trapa incisa TaxID=236973 RepID=A0AAN7L7I3_9MYRT|nr:hypothetical protein SAY87_024067 [Trapa incisa]
MDLPRKNQVSLRGASAKEITRDALLEKVSQERELRSYVRRANAAALQIQRLWRRFIVTRRAASQIQEEWEILLHLHPSAGSSAWISISLLRPFLFFITRLSNQLGSIRMREAACIQNCFKIILESIKSPDPQRNFCSLAVGSSEEKRTWTYQAKSLITLCASVLAACEKHHPSILVITSLAMRLLVTLTDPKEWKMIINCDRSVLDMAAKELVIFLGSESGFYVATRKYIVNLDFPLPLQKKVATHTDEKFLITASVITLALRPFHAILSNVNNYDDMDIHHVTKCYISSLLTVPWLVQRLPSVLVPALKHKSVILRCFQTLQIYGAEILMEMSVMDHPAGLCYHRAMLPAQWVLANIIYLILGNESGSIDAKIFSQGLDYAKYVQVVVILAENICNWIEKAGLVGNELQELKCNCEASLDPNTALPDTETTQKIWNMSFVDSIRPLCHQSHLTELLGKLKERTATDGADMEPSRNTETMGTLKLIDVAYFYSYLVRIFSVFNPVLGSLPVLNTLSFTPGMLTTIWGVLESYLFSSDTRDENNFFARSCLDKEDTSTENQKQALKGGTSKWSSVLHKITGKSQTGLDHNNTESTVFQTSIMQIDRPHSDVWDVELLRCGPQGIPRDIICLLFLFCATYSHLLLVLDDIEFYEKQVPFTLEQQRRITSALNTLVYNGLSKGSSMQNKHLMECAVKCLHMMYERDCRHQFCPPSLWLSPATQSRPPIQIAARIHGVLLTKSDDLLPIPTLGSVITTVPHVYPFEERVEMFREFIKMDRVSRVMSGEDSGPGLRKVEVVIRRGHVVEDGFRQLNFLGSRLKSSIHVSFVSECGLPEAGLDYGGLSKEFLTDLSKAAFSPEYGLFCQTSTVDRLLIPNSSAKDLDNGLQMIEFLGRVVGKALYESILLDYSFSHVFVQKLLGRYSFLDELSTLDPEMYRNLMYVKHYEGDVKELSLDFTITEESFGKRNLIELKPGGKDTCVTNENKMQYIHAMADYKLNRQILPFANAFYRGMSDLISPSWLKLFNANEFNQLLSGGKIDIDVDDLRKNTHYTGGYSEGSRTIKLFWEVMQSFVPRERCMLLKFVTSCSRAPLLGFKYLQPTFTIQKVACDVPLWASFGGQDVDRLPSASTCYNTLKLPTYKRSGTLRTKLLYAINSNAGFELS